MKGAGNIQRLYQPPGPVAAAFLRSRAAISLIMGPIGSGKTSACVMRALHCARYFLAPGPDGITRAKLAVIRGSYPELTKTTIPSWLTWLPANLPGADFKAGSNPPTYTFSAVYGNRPIDLTVEFIALGDRRVEDVMRGWEGTFAWLNEADRLEPEVLTYVFSRLGRYPSAAMGGCQWLGLWADFNAPDEQSYLYPLATEANGVDVAFFRQPGGLDAGAENIQNLPAGYYQNQLKLVPDWFARRMIHNLWGYDRSGKPVFDEFNDLLHITPLVPDPRLPLHIGIDAGLTPAAVFVQVWPGGQIRVFGELVTEQCGPTRFAEHLLARLAQDDFKKLTIGRVGVDPAAFAGGDEQGGDEAWTGIVRSASKLRLIPACRNNSLGPRLDAVKKPLSRLIEGRPGFLMDPRCVVLRRGFNSTYRFRKLPGTGGFDGKPEKNSASHPMDALQYAILVAGGTADTPIDRPSHAPATPSAASWGFNPFA